jgi:small subunit ribosomal protein S13
MIYLFESELPENKSVYFALRRIYGIGKANSSLICRKVGFSANLKIKKLSKDQTIKLIKTIENLNIEIAKTLVSIRSYRGLRRKQGLPVRGQRTHTNAKSARKRSSFS